MRPVPSGGLKVETSTPGALKDALNQSGWLDDEDGNWYEARIRPGQEASFPRAGASLTDLPDGLASESGTLVVGTERIPVLRQAATGDPSTDGSSSCSPARDSSAVASERG
jgi:hypothetical protein